jgi:hypothetical protein
MTPRLRALSELALIVLVGCVLAAALTYPLAFQIDRVGRVNTEDGRWSIWVVAWVAHTLTTNPAQLFDANIFYPHKSALAFSEANIGAGVLAAPVWVLTKNPHLTHNAVVLMSFVIAFAGAYYLIRYFTRSRPTSFIAGVLFAFCPFIFARTAHIQLLMTGGLPLCMLAFHRLVERTTVGRSLTLGLLIWAQALACAYYGIFAVLAVGLGTVMFAVSRGLWRSRDYWVAIALAAFVSAALALPFLVPYLRVQHETGFVRTLDDARQFSVTLGAWLASNAWAHRWWLSAIGDFNEVLFPGIATLSLGIAGALYLLTRATAPASPAKIGDPVTLPAIPRDVAWFYLTVAVIAFWASFGPDAGLYWVLYKTVPLFSFLRAPGRIGILVVLSLIVLGAPLLASAITRARRPSLALACVALIVSVDLTAVPLTQYRPVRVFSTVHSLLSTLPRGPVIALPFWHERGDYPRHAFYMLRSTRHFMPLINGYSDHIPQSFRDVAPTLSTFPSREAFAALEPVGARYALFHLDLYGDADRQALFERLPQFSPYLRMVGRDDYVWLYEIVDWPH